ncbi:MAG: hypothetical protein SNJ71_00320 [Bacteroidales bacterium]
MTKNINPVGVIAVAISSILFLMTLNVKKTKFINYIGENGYLPSYYPRGIRNNNPGNLKINDTIQWIGKLPRHENTDKTFEQFYTYDYGVRAMAIDLKTKINKHGTIAKIIQFYAPPTENNTEAYIASVERKTGINRNTYLIPNAKTLKSLVMAVIEHENGGKFYDYNKLDSIISKIAIP